MPTFMQAPCPRRKCHHGRRMRLARFLHLRVVLAASWEVPTSHITRADILFHIDFNRTHPFFHTPTSAPPSPPINIVSLPYQPPDPVRGESPAWESPNQKQVDNDLTPITTPSWSPQIADVAIVSVWPVSVSALKKKPAPKQVYRTRSMTAPERAWRA
ncbi:hypothetical protein FB45DRAFT_1042844 [Roridomyces roridus]|uniref:Uncharacterized protein n=1 Tax=Roridomyces roridus TaxID=1738132 RepID=A0AAD7F9C4_9AGAR|nr:hypothetical protein FB45DRAFT_1042844 [Roridomyces roridus]